MISPAASPLAATNIKAVQLEGWMIRSWLKILGYTLKRRNACHAILRNDFGEECVYYHGNRSTAYYVKRKKKATCTAWSNFAYNANK